VGGTGTEEAREDKGGRAAKGQLNLDPTIFKDIFTVQKGSNYDKQNFKVYTF